MELQVLAAGEAPVQGAVVGEDEAERLARGPTVLRRVDAVHEDRAGIRIEEARHDADERGLARAVRTDEPGDPARASLEVDPLEDPHGRRGRAAGGEAQPSGGGPVAAIDPGELEHRR